MGGEWVYILFHKKITNIGLVFMRLQISEYVVIGAYLAMLFAIALVFRTFNKNTSDFFRGGGQSKWWLVGSSAFMASFSAWTFTGAAGVAYLYGWSVAVIFVANTVGFLVNFAYFAPRFRQMRCITIVFFS